jgi:hypothetical protein
VESRIPFRYLGVLLNYVRLSNLDFREDEEKMEKRTHVCKGRQNSYGGSLDLVKSSISNILFTCFLCLRCQRALVRNLISL